MSLDLLANTVKSAPQILLESLPKVREAFDYLSFLPPPTAVGFMKAILPLMKISVGLKDGLMLTLRKALFSRYMLMFSINVHVLFGNQLLQPGSLKNFEESSQ